MLAESLVYLMSLPATPADFRAFLVEAVGLWARGHRQARDWAPHLSRTMNLIGDTIEEVQPRRTVVVLGSGPLFDVPLEALAGAFARVILVDRAHLATSRRRVGRLANVERQWRDLSAATTPQPLGFLDAIPELDWVISLNLLSQLGRGAPEGEERKVIDAHLGALSALPCRATLVTDRDFQVLDRSGAVVERFDLLHGRTLPEPDAAWDWDVAPFGEEGARTRRVHSVTAYRDWQAAHRSGGK